MQIIDQDQQCAVLRGRGAQAVCSRRHREAVGGPVLAGAFVTEAERAPQGRGLPFGQRGQVIRDRMQQRVQACEAKLGFGLYPGRPQDPHGPGPAGGIIG